MQSPIVKFDANRQCVVRFEFDDLRQRMTTFEVRGCKVHGNNPCGECWRNSKGSFTFGNLNSNDGTLMIHDVNWKNEKPISPEAKAMWEFLNG